MRFAIVVWNRGDIDAQIIAKLDVAYLSNDRVKAWAFPIIDKHMRLACKQDSRYVIVWLQHDESGIVLSGEDLIDEYALWLLHEAELEADIENELNDYERIHGADGELAQRHGCSAF